MDEIGTFLNRRVVLAWSEVERLVDIEQIAIIFVEKALNKLSNTLSIFTKLKASLSQFNSSQSKLAINC